MFPSRMCLVQQFSNKLELSFQFPSSPGCPGPCGLVMLRSGQRTLRRGTAGHGGHFVLCHKGIVTAPAQGFALRQELLGVFAPWARPGSARMRL